MTRFETPRVAVVGTGEIGRGWAALAIGAGWPVTIFDADAEVLTPAQQAIGDRVVGLVREKRADPMVAEEALARMKVGRSLLQAVSEADWIIEAVPDDLALKQKTLHLAEQVARRAAVITSSSAGFGPSQLIARLEHPNRFLVAHPMVPVEYIPLVEVVPGPRTDPECVEDIRFWLSMLGRAPIVLKKEVTGNVAARLQAALLREAVQLVLDGVLDVEDVDRALSAGPALGWAASGVHLENHLNAGPWNLEVFLANKFGAYEAVWKTLADWKALPPEGHKKLARAIEKAYSQHVKEMREARDQRLVRMLEALRE
jgi:carnitine 3-dehydrogenase